MWEYVKTIEDIAHCPPSNNDWLVGFNDYSRHDEVIAVLDTAIAASEPCQQCDTPLQTDDVNFDSNHTGTDTFVIEGADGKWGFKCQHNSCKGRH